MYLLTINPEIQTEGWLVTISGFLIVIIALIILCLIFASFSKLINFKSNKNNDEKAAEDNVRVKTSNSTNVENDVAVAIALALALAADVHDQESDIITIEHIQRRYSPWSSKYYGMNNQVK